MKKHFSDAERDSIMLRIRERCSTSLSARAECMGRNNPFLTVVPYPYQEGNPRANFGWSTARRIADAGGKFDLS